MGYGDYQSRHLLDQDPTPWDPPAQQSVRHTNGIAWGTPYAVSDAYAYKPAGPPTAPPQPPQPPARAWRSDWQAPAPAIPAHQHMLAVAVAREHGRRFKHELRISDIPSAAEVRRLLAMGRPWWHKMGLGNRTVGVLLHLAPTRVAMTPEGFFIMARPPDGRALGRLAPLCSADFSALGTPEDFMYQVESELNSILRRRTELWRELILFQKPQKSLHTCRSRTCG